MSSYSLLDSRLVASVSNAQLAPGPVTKEPANPLFVEDRPWEVRLDNVYANIARDSAMGLYRCWYSPFIVDKAETTTPRERRAAAPYKPTVREMGVCYAESRDGMNWIKPDLGLCEFDGSARNNLVLRGPHGTGVFRDDHDADPARRYKLLCVREGTGNVMEVAFSPDGLHWSAPVPCPSMGADGDTHNNALWVPELSRYVGFTRLWSQGAYRGVRVVGRTESPDFVHWTQAEPVLQGLDDTHQVYAMPVFHYGEGYLGLPMIFDTAADRVHCELAWSADTVHWERIAPGEPLIPNGPAGSWDWGCVYAAAHPVFLENETRLYYGGSDNVHTNWRRSGLGLARLQSGRFAGYRADPGTEGEVVTRPLPCLGAGLGLNLDATHGAVTVTLEDAAGNALAESACLTGDSAAAPVVWRTGRLDALAGRSVCLGFRLHDAVLYGFDWSNP